MDSLETALFLFFLEMRNEYVVALMAMIFFSRWLLSIRKSSRNRFALELTIFMPVLLCEDKNQMQNSL